MERSISPRKCISFRELHTTRRMPKVCSPSTSHFSWKNRCIPLLDPFPRVKSRLTPRASTHPLHRPTAPPGTAACFQFLPSLRSDILTPNCMDPRLVSSPKVHCYSPCFFIIAVYVCVGAEMSPGRSTPPTPLTSTSHRCQRLFKFQVKFGRFTASALAGWWQLFSLSCFSSHCTDSKSNY